MQDKEEAERLAQLKLQEDKDGKDSHHVEPPPPPYLNFPEENEFPLDTCTENDNTAPLKKKRKVTRNRGRSKLANLSAEATEGVGIDGGNNDNDNSDENYNSDDDVKQSANTARRILWQRGHAALVPSVVMELIKKATVSRVEDALEPLKTLGFAILEDMTEAFHPKNRCTKEQRDYIEKCISPISPPRSPPCQHPSMRRE